MSARVPRRSSPRGRRLRGLRHVWTTFSSDQVDLNYAQPAVLLEIVDILLTYLRRGARIIRLDAVAFLWKEPGTRCLHQPQTHLIVKLLRDVVETVAPGTLLLTETNVPQAENVAYWGDGDEAHLIYNFCLGPLLLDALLSGDATWFQRWLAATPDPPPGTTFLNFTASHDGIGLRPLEGILPKERIDRLVDAAVERGGIVSSRTGSDGREFPYELNITWFDALSDPGPRESPWAFRRHLASQAVMLALRGIPAVYFQSLIGASNDTAGVAHSGRARSINRRKFTRDEWQGFLKPSSRSLQVLNAYRRLLSRRAATRLPPRGTAAYHRHRRPGRHRLRPRRSGG